MDDDLVKSKRSKRNAAISLFCLASSLTLAIAMTKHSNRISNLEDKFSENKRQIHSVANMTDDIAKKYRATLSKYSDNNLSEIAEVIIINRKSNKIVLTEETDSLTNEKKYRIINDSLKLQPLDLDSVHMIIRGGSNPTSRIGMKKTKLLLK